MILLRCKSENWRWHKDKVRPSEYDVIEVEKAELYVGDNSTHIATPYFLELIEQLEPKAEE